QHYHDEELNTAYFFVNCPTDTLERIVDQLKDDLRIYREDEPFDFEPFRIKEERRALPRISIRPQHEGQLTAPNLKLEMPPGSKLVTLIKKKSYGFNDEDLASPGRAVVNVVSVRTGEVQQ